MEYNYWAWLFGVAMPFSIFSPAVFMLAFRSSRPFHTLLKNPLRHFRRGGYDPANPKFDVPLKKVDLIFSTDVLEHIEPEHLDATLEEIKEHSTYIYHLISCAPAKLILPDGRNAHLIQQPPEWWKQKHLAMGYEVIKEEYREFNKYSKQLGKNIPVKNYFIMARLS